MPTRTILVAEDFTAFNQFVCGQLRERPDFRVVSVADGVAAVRAAEDLQPDLALLDIGLPMLNGIAAAKDIRAHSPRSRVVFLTQESSPEIVDAARDLGADGYILKTRSRYMLPIVEAMLTGEPESDGRPRIAPGDTTNRPRHDVLFYASDAALLDSAERMVVSALAAQDAAIVTLTKPHLDALGARLQRRRQPAIDQAIERGTFLTIDATEAVLEITSSATPDWDALLAGWAGVIASAAAATGRRQPRVAAFGELSALLLATGHIDAAIELEALGARMFEPERPTQHATCAYPALPPLAPFNQICALHEMVAVR